MLVQAGEDEDLKRMMWVVENLQEELLTADEARMAADQQVQARSKVVQGLQVRPNTVHLQCLVVCRGADLLALQR